MAFLAALPEIAEGAEAAGGAAEAGGAAGGASSGGGGMMSKAGSLFKKIPGMGGGESNKQQNVGASRNLEFQEAAESARGALRPGGNA